MKPYRLTQRKAGRLFLKTANGILILCTLLVEPVLAQVGNPAREEKSSGGRPDFSGIPANEAKAIENACDSARRYRGPGDYYQCLQSELGKLQRFLGPSKRLTANEPKPEPANRPTREASAEKAIQQTEEVINSEKSPAKQTIPSKQADFWA